MSTTLISYNAHGAHDDAIGVFPTLWRLRVKFPDHPRSFRAPWAPIPSIWLTILVLFASVQPVAPRFGSEWPGDDFRPDGWAADEKVGLPADPGDSAGRLRRRRRNLLLPGRTHRARPRNGGAPGGGGRGGARGIDAGSSAARLPGQQGAALRPRTDQGCDPMRQQVQHIDGVVIEIGVRDADVIRTENRIPFVPPG